MASWTPKESVDLDTQLCGLDYGNKLAEDLERLARDSVDPPIPGLIVKPIPLSNGKYVVVVHVPPSSTRPYRTNHSGHVNFYIRHSESVFPMNTHDIREAVLASATAEAKVREYLNTCEIDTEEYVTKGTPSLLLQAMPLISPETPWNVTDDKILSIIRDSDRQRQKAFRFPLESLIYPTRTLDGIIGRDDRVTPNWITEVHTNGYISALDTKPLNEQKTQEHTYLTIDRFHFEFFKAFTFFCSQILDATRTDSPYVLRCKMLNAKGVYLYAAEGFTRFHGPWQKPTLAWPDQMRQTGEAFDKIAIYWCETLYHAFGVDLRL